MFKWICAIAGLVALSAGPALGVISNGFDSDRIYALWGGANTPLDGLLTHSKLTVVSTADNWVEVGEASGTATSGTFWGHQFTSLTFSCSPTAGANTPSGYRLFYLGRERAPDFDTYRPILVEVDSSSPPQKLREAYIGNIVCGDKSFCGANNVQNWPHVNLRYNPTNNTLMVGISHNGTGTGGVLHGYIYELTLPDSPEGTGLGSPDELQGITLMETYDTGLIGDVDASGGVNIDVAPDGTVYFRQPVSSSNVYSFSTAGGSTPGGTTSSPTLVVTGATLTAAAGNGLGNWQSAIYRPVSNSLVNLQRRTSGNPPIPAMVDYSLTTHTATLIPGSAGYRGQQNGMLDAATGDIWIASQNLPSLGGGARKYTADTPGVLAQWDNLGAEEGGRQLFDIAVPPGSPGACCRPTSIGGGCEVLSMEDCAAIAGAWQGPGSVCDESACPTGACCAGCGRCDERQQADCTGDRVWMGANTVCGQVACPSDLCGTPRADANCDGSVDQTDFALLQACLWLDPLTVPACTCLDLTSNNVIDNADLTAFELCASGPGIPLNPACAD